MCTPVFPLSLPPSSLVSSLFISIHSFLFLPLFLQYIHLALFFISFFIIFFYNILPCLLQVMPHHPTLFIHSFRSFFFPHLFLQYIYLALFSISCFILFFYNTLPCLLTVIQLCYIFSLFIHSFHSFVSPSFSSIHLSIFVLCSLFDHFLS